MRPTIRSAWLLMAGVPIAVVPVLIGDRFWLIWLSYVVVCVLAIGVDAILARPRRRPEITPVVPAALYIGNPGDLLVDIRIRHSFPPTSLEAVCALDPLLHPVPPQSVALSERVGRVVIPLIALRRGIAKVGDFWVRWTGPLGLMSYQVRRSLALEIPVVPDVQAVRQAALRFFGSREVMVGEKLELYTGAGSEFEQLREFVTGLDHRAMDWKASARHRKLLCREFRAERNHQIVIAFDTGHLMSEPVLGIPKLDHAINAGLLLTWFSLRAGDRVGLFGFDKGPNLYVAPEGGLGSFRRLQLASSQLAYSTEETNFTLGLAELSVRLRRRSLVVLLTDFVDTVTAELMVDDLERLSRHHLVVFVALRNPELDTIAAVAPRQVPDMARSVVAAGILRERELVLRRLHRLGIQALGAPPDQISSALLNRYLDIKRRELIA